VTLQTLLAKSAARTRDHGAAAVLLALRRLFDPPAPGAE